MAVAALPYDRGAMSAQRLRSLLQRRLAWLLWLALLLPLAQSAALAHGLTHLPARAGTQALHEGAALEAPCDLCLMAAALGAGAVPAATARLTPPPAADALLLPLARDVWSSPAPQLYRSRAPPSALL